MFITFDIQKQLDQFPIKSKVLVSPLNWGIGHATRCIPIIRQLLSNGFQPIIASDNEALALLRKTFPELPYYELPAYQVRYTKHKNRFNIALLSQIPKFYKTYKSEQKEIEKIVEKEGIKVMISDNRFGVYHKGITNVYITHQVRVKSGWTTYFTSKIHQKLISKYEYCWVPDVEGEPNLSGLLSHHTRIKKKLNYIGTLSALNKTKEKREFDILVLLSGPEPQRSLLENKLIEELQNTTKKVCFVKGIVSGVTKKSVKNNITFYNYLLGSDLNSIFNKSDVIISRSGYSTIMDLAKLQKTAFFIPTPGQSEQIYLAQHIEKQGIAPYSLQENFSLNSLDSLKNYNGFSGTKTRSY
jgi:predicted glycosyltransferase